MVRSASIMVVGDAYEDAVRKVKENSRLDIGIHLCLTEEKPVLAREEISTLVGRNGNFLKSRIVFILNYILGRISIKEVERELEAQIRKVLNDGIEISHIDSHAYIHMLPLLLKIVIRLAKEYNIPFIRWPYERLLTFKAKLSRHILLFNLNLLCLSSKKNIKNSNLFMAEYFYGFLQSGHLFKEHLKGILKRVNNGVAEIVCHPGIYDEETTRYSHWGYAWEEELKALTSTDIKKAIADWGIELISFREI